jgi:biopolymer transport protein ExbD
MSEQPTANDALWRVRKEDASGEGSGLAYADLAHAVADGLLGESDEVRGPLQRQWVRVGEHPDLEEHLPPAPLYKSKSYDEADMDMTPMIDVTFQLMIFFMITAAFVVQKTLDVPAAHNQSNAPRRYTMAELARNNVVVTVKTGGAITVDGQPVAMEGVLGAVRQAMRGRDNAEMVLDAEDAVEHETVVQVLDAAAGVQIEKVHFLRRAPPAGAAKPDSSGAKKPVR